ncbi:hypothetical protein F4054_08210 [Candidatus Poribacteria bacterium]|nr:hypothetical protein [Candidatus Poribacteria bacterium]MYG05129.1 hypothetical protein [Candidatus Poribacteria bacterium]MYK22228.1 hypothetical protein [Candidatus Poribacteria bacterium]
MSFVDTDTLKAFCLVVFGWLKAHGLIVGIISGASLVGSIFLCALVIVYLPCDYFLAKRRVSRIRQPVLWGVLIVLKNLLAVILIIVGIILIPLPGQGVLTVLIGLVISDIPGKRKLERRIIRSPAVLSALNHIRSRFNRPLLVLDEPTTE